MQYNFFLANKYYPNNPKYIEDEILFNRLESSVTEKLVMEAKLEAAKLKKEYYKKKMELVEKKNEPKIKLETKNCINNEFQNIC